jgi:hypothetical protein
MARIAIPTSTTNGKAVFKVNFFMLWEILEIFLKNIS